MSDFRVNELDDIDRQVNKVRMEMIASQDAKRQVEIEIANREMDLTMRKHDINALDAKIQRLRDNVAFVESGWKTPEVELPSDG
mmetsp:Transcript_10824/g.33191  ORF Transcript_10824/g.33191 Transcript_10824/m.33191 type:complete len:84 (+) Transcript_10824:266-517(+)